MTREAWQSWVGFHPWRKREAMRGVRPQPETDPENGSAVDKIGIASPGSIPGRRRDDEDPRATCVKGCDLSLARRAVRVVARSSSRPCSPPRGSGSSGLRIQRPVSTKLLDPAYYRAHAEILYAEVQFGPNRVP